MFDQCVCRWIEMLRKMLKLLWLFCLIALGIAVDERQRIKLLELNKSCGDANSDRIINGNNATLGQFPWIVLLQFGGKISSFFLCIIHLLCTVSAKAMNLFGLF